MRDYPDNMEILVQESLVRHQLGDRKAAIATLERLLSSREADDFASVEGGTTQPRAPPPGCSIGAPA